MARFQKMALKATQGEAPFKYLGVITDGSVNNGSLLYTTDEVLNPKAKFAVEFSHNDLFHIRSCFNNKYWVRHPKDTRIVARANEPEKDEKSEGCTLFKMEINTSNKNAKFYHVQSGAVVRVGTNSTIGKNFLTLDTAFPAYAVSSVVDYDDFVVLPKFVAFKGSNNLYYKNFTAGTGLDSYAQFSVRDITDPNIVCECLYSNDGHLRVRAVNSGASNMFWRCGDLGSPENIIDWYQDRPTDPRQMFDAIRISDDMVFALRSRFNNKFCVRSDFKWDSGTKNRLVAKGNNGPEPDSHLRVVEPVLNRTVNVYEFNLDRARIYDVSLLYSHENIWDNYSEETHSGTTNGSIVSTTTHTFSNTITASMTVKTTFETKIPFIAKAGVDVSATGTYARMWGTTTTETQQIGHTFNVTVIPRKTTVARGVATKAKCDVPFSYVQKDYPTHGGPPIVTKLHDGVFTGANAYHFRTEVRHENLPPHKGTRDQAPTQCIKRPMKSIAA